MTMDRPYIAWDDGSDRLVVSLPHHCGEWDIGGLEEVRQMIQALGMLLPEFERLDAYRHPHPCPRCGVVVYMGSSQCPGSACSGRARGWVCPACFYPAQDERRAACQAGQHPERACEMPWCWDCSWCRLGCRCEQPGKTFGHVPIKAEDVALTDDEMTAWGVSRGVPRYPGPP